MLESRVLELLRNAAELLRAGRAREAEVIYRGILGGNPGQREALAGVGTVCYAAGDFGGAVAYLSEAGRIGEFSAEIRINLGMALLAVGQVDAAVGEMRGVVERRPEMVAGRLGFAMALRAKGQITDAIEEMREAVRLYPQPGILVQLADLLDLGGRRGEAIEVFEGAIGGITPPVDWVCRLAEMQLADHQCDAALANYRRAVKIAPANATVRGLLANALSYQREFDEGVAQLRMAVELAPDAAAIHSALLMAMLHHKETGPGDFLREARKWGDRYGKKSAANGRFGNTREPGRRLRVGYLSTFFRFSAEAHYLVPLLEHHDPAQVEIFCYPTGKIVDGVTERMRAAGHAWRSLHGASDAAAVEMIRDDRIDVLVTLDNHLQDNRLGVLVRKPAPICVTWLLSCATTGCEVIDYRITDPFVDPVGCDESVYAERTWRLPETFCCYDPLSDVAPKRMGDRLGDRPVTFGALNRVWKLNDDCLAAFGEVVARAPGSRLLVMAPPGNARRGIERKLEACGCEPGRIDWVYLGQNNEFLGYFDRVDLMLDTFPYNGHTTTLDALWMGVPVISLAAAAPIGRVGASILGNMGLGELVAETREDFVGRAAELARDAKRLSEYHATLRKRMMESPLMNGAMFARNMEGAYRGMWGEWVWEGSAPMQTLQ